MNPRQFKKQLDRIEGMLRKLTQEEAEPLSTYDRDAGGWTRLPDEHIGKTGKCNRCGDLIWWQQCQTKNGIKNLPFYPATDGETILRMHSYECENPRPTVVPNSEPF